MTKFNLETTLTQNWDNNGKVFFTDENNQIVRPRNTFFKVGRNIKALHTNTNNWLNHSDYDKNIQRQKINIGLSSLMALASGGRFKVSPKTLESTEDIVAKFFDENSPNLENLPEPYNGSRNPEDVINHLGGKNKHAEIKTPLDNIIFNDKNIPHLLNDNEFKRLEFLNQMIDTAKKPRLIIEGSKNNNLYRYYAKPYKSPNGVKGYLDITRNKPIGNFYQTSYPIRSNKLFNLIKEGQVIYKDPSYLPTGSTAPISKDMPVYNIINGISDNINPSNGLFGKLMELLKGINKTKGR